MFTSQVVMSWPVPSVPYSIFHHPLVERRRVGAARALPRTADTRLAFSSLPPPRAAAAEVVLPLAQAGGEPIPVVVVWARLAVSGPRAVRAAAVVSVTAV